MTNEQAVTRYQYLLRTAPPEAIEQTHEEAFAQLTSEQRKQVLQALSNQVPPQERSDRDDPQSLARMATRAELRQPGTLERTFGGMTRGRLGGFLAFDFLSTIAGVVVGSAIADAIFTNDGAKQGSEDDTAAADDSGTEDAAVGGDGDFAANDLGGNDFGGDFGGDY